MMQRNKDIYNVYTPTRVAVLVDGGFFLKRYNAMYNKDRSKTASTVANDICRLANFHVGKENYLYRIFYYDCVPSDKRVHNPISKKCVNFAKSEEYLFKVALINELKKKRKVALRLGILKDVGWQFKGHMLEEVISGTKTKDNLSSDDVTYRFQQKGIDIKIGVDIASMTFKRFVDKIVLISGDSDFVPAAKLARREGIDFVLDAMYARHIDNSLFEHIDGLKSRKLYIQDKTTPTE